MPLSEIGYHDFLCGSCLRMLQSLLPALRIRQQGHYEVAQVHCRQVVPSLAEA